MKKLPCGSKCLLIISIFAQAAAVWPQVTPPSPPKVAANQLDKKLNDQEIRGEGIFMQRCAVCHIAKSPTRKSAAAIPGFGPSLNGLMKDAKPMKPSEVRKIILKGGPKMPGFEYGLETREVDDLIAYLKTL